MSEWISCNEKLPDANTPVLVHYKSVFANSVQSVAIYFDDECWRQLIGGWHFNDATITHWMPLPEPPNKS